MHHKVWKKYWWYSRQFHDISTQLEPWCDELKSFILRVGNCQNTNRSALIRFICVGIGTSLRSRHFTLGVQVPKGAYTPRAKRSYASEAMLNVLSNSYAEYCFAFHTASEASGAKRITHEIGSYLLSLATIQIDRVAQIFFWFCYRKW